MGPTVRAVLVLVNQAPAGKHNPGAEVYVQDDTGWYHLHVGEHEEVGDVRRFVESGEYRRWPQDAPYTDQGFRATFSGTPSAKLE